MAGFINTRTNYICTLLLAITFLAAACSKADKPGPNPPNPNPNPVPEIPTDAEKTPVGTPIGQAEQKMIGTNGGTFTTADGRISLEFPAGALNAATNITIQPVTNNCPGGSGNVLRITPHNVNFNKPVKLSFSYGDTDYISSMPAAMTIAYQDSEGYWRAAENMVKDTANKKVWVTTKHFSDWAIFKSVELVPYSAMVEPGKQLQLGVVKLADFKNDSLIPVPDPLKKRKGIVKEWKLAGEGTLVKNAANGDDAIYTAPNAIPARNPVAVSATLNISSNWQFTLVSNIYIGNEGLTFRIDGGEWQYCVDPDGILFDGYFYSITAANLTSPGVDGVTIRWAGQRPVHYFLKWGLAWPGFVYGPDPTTTYTQLLAPEGSPSPGGLYFLFGSENLEYAVGTFTLTPAQRVIVVPGKVPLYSKHRIEGFFKVKWKK
jgi:hypothetical protein